MMRVLQRFWQLPLHTFLFGVFPVLFLFAQNQRELQLPVVIIPIALVWLVCFTLVSVSALITKNWLRAALCVSYVVVLFFVYPHLYSLVGYGRIELGSLVVTTSKLFNAAMLIAAAGGLTLILRSKLELLSATKVMNTVALSLVLMGLVTAYSNQATGSLNQRVASGEVAGASTLTPTQKPDIYYLIFDRYANQASLDTYGFDNAPFLEALAERGGKVTNKSLGNYPNTTSSLASSLNMKYLDELAEKVGRESNSVTPLRASIEDNAVSQFLRSQDYAFYNVGSWWEGTRTNSFATKNYVAEERNLGLDEFSTNLFFIDTPLGKLASRFFPKTHTGHADRFEFQFNSLREISRKPEATYTFSHILMPHDPYVFNADCTMRTEEMVDGSSYQVNYLQQLACLNTKLLTLIDDILAKSDTPPLIILQSDEGPHPILHPKTGSSWLGYPDATYQEKLRIFSVVIAPDDFALPSGNTPVNTFREVFNHYFGSQFEILENRSYVFEREERPYKFVEVTEKVAFPE